MRDGYIVLKIANQGVDGNTVGRSPTVLGSPVPYNDGSVNLATNYQGRGESKCVNDVNQNAYGQIVWNVTEIT